MPSSMHYWEKLEGSDDSFAKLFQTKFKAPDDHSSSCSIKSLSIDEIHSSDPSLRSLKRFEIDQLTLPQGYDHVCAMEKFSVYGPQGFLQSWEHDNILFGFPPPRILGKTPVVRYLEEAFLNRAMCGVLFLFSLATGLNATRFPSPESCTIVNQSTSGPSGRPDLQFVRNGKLCCLVEVKTRRVCLSDGKDVLDMDGPVYFLYGDRGILRIMSIII